MERDCACRTTRCAVAARLRALAHQQSQARREHDRRREQRPAPACCGPIAQLLGCLAEGTQQLELASTARAPRDVPRQLNTLGLRERAVDQALERLRRRTPGMLVAARLDRPRKIRRS
jgi:hypothetical protein